jgi:lipopolysaccharide transport system ATP-binding protein
MNRPIIDVRHLGKSYQLGAIGMTSLRDEAERLWQRVRHRPTTSVEGRTGQFWALRDVSFCIQRGEVVGIIGRNGAGKSTLLKLLSRITQQTEGEITLRGRIASLLEVGTGFHPELSGRENVFLNGAILGMTKAEIRRKFDEIVAFAGVESFLDTPVKRYSSGMYVRLAFAVAAHLEPEILLVDEVLAVGDHDFQKKCLGKMGDIARDGRTVLLVSHNMASVVNLCQRAILLHSGRMAADGVASDVVQQYLCTTGSNAGEMVWSDAGDAPGTDIVRLQAVRILQEGIDGPTAAVDISKDVIIEITYRNLREGALLYPAIRLKTGLGADVLSSSNAKSMNLATDQWYACPQPPGVFQSICRIPGNFLNEGRYRLTVILGTLPTNTQVLEEDLLSFDVYDTGEMRKEYYGGWMGVVRPRLAWQTTHLETVHDLTKA